jgi:hypothetical protein
VNVLDLVRPSQKDIGSGQRIARRYLEIVTVTTAAANLTVNSSTVGNDLVRFIHTICWTTQAGAAQTNLYVQALLQDAFTNVLNAVNAQFDYAPVAAGINTKTVSGLELVLMQGELLNVQAGFSGGAAANTVTAYLQGWEFPRGNLQR